LKIRKVLTEASDEIKKIIDKVEVEEGLPKGILNEIYEQELVQVHRENRTSYVEKSLRELIIKYFEKK